MVQSRVDPCLLLQRNHGSLSGMVISQVDDIVMLETESSLRTEDETSAMLLSEEKKCNAGNEITFNAVELSLTSDNEILTTQQKNTIWLKIQTTQEAF